MAGPSDSEAALGKTDLSRIALRTERIFNICASVVEVARPQVEQRNL